MTEPTAFLRGDSEMAARIRGHDWSATPLGPLDAWPQSLKAVVGMMVAALRPMVLLWGHEGVLIYNDGYAAFAAERHPQLLGMGAREGWPEIADFNDANIGRALAGESWSLRDQELALDRGAGLEPAWLDLDYSPVFDDDGDPAGLIVLVTETTERRAAEQRADIERQRQRDMLQQMPGFAAVMSGPEHRFDYCNDAYREISGGRAKVGMTVRDVFPELEGQGFYELLDRVFESGEPFFAHATPVDLADRGSRLLDFVYSPIRDADGRTSGVFVGGYDVTDATVAARALSDSEARYRALFDAVDEGFCIIEFIDGPHGPLSDYVHVEANAAYAANAGIPDVVGQKVRAMVGAEAQEWIDLYKGVLDTGRPIRFEKELEATGRWLELAAFRVEPAERRQVAVLFKDLTARRQAEIELQALNTTLEERVEARTQELQAAHEALRQSQKMEAVGQLTGGIAHDFNNLLAGISGSLELLSKRMAEGRLMGIERYIDGAQASAQRAAALTQRLLAFSRRQTLDSRPIDANRLILDMEDLIRRSVGPTVTVEVRAEDELWATRIDASQLENALLNLCINARDAMAPDGGRLTISTANRHFDGEEATRRDLPPGDYVSLCVTDTGAGMSDEVKRKAFDPFFTTKPLGQGTGLGLSMIHGFMRQSGGQVRIYSEPGQGATVCLYLPRHDGPAEQADPQPVARAPLAGRGETVVVIDDEETLRLLVVEVLGEAGYRVLHAPDGPSGLQLLRQEPRVDLLVTDVGLPGGMNGRQVADAARQDRPDLKVLFITGYAEQGTVGDGRLDPGMEVVTKPFAMADLADRVRQMIEGG